MSDNEQPDNKVKPTVFYTQKSQEDASTRERGKREADKFKSNGRSSYGKPSSDRPRSEKPRSESRRSNDSRVETFGSSSYGKPSSDRPRSEKPRSESRRSNDSRVETFGSSSYGKPSSDRPRSEKPHSESRRSNDSRVETFGSSSYGKPSSDRPRSEKSHSENNRANERHTEKFKPRDKSAADGSDSPWKNRFQNTEQLPTFDTESKSPVDRERIKRQRKEEILIYSENSCKAVFNHRPDSIIKAFLLQDKTYEFKALVAYLVKHRLGYNVITDEEMTKIAQTPHHGGICLIVKKRQAQLVSDYLSKSTALEQDCVLAIDDINNPHNLGGIVRTAAFFNVNGLLLRQPDLLENGAALRVSEGGAETITPIKSDDLLASIDHFKQQGYQIIALLPCKVNSINAETLATAKMSSKVVFIIFQQINIPLASLADKVIYVSGSESMSALNISVLTGIVLAKWQEKTSKM
ncbi:tRNA/rRNA methyltransferase [Orbus sturtevantii]|uniref:tRNA/rRNA methyltransferase n=1 Tax=Orbus sturtevantii TaxID=3074109 RepID=UPI00370D1409